MDDDQYKICIVCSTVYQGNITKYNQNSTVTPGICRNDKCIEKYLTQAIKKAKVTNDEQATQEVNDLQNKIYQEEQKRKQKGGTT